MLVHMTPSEVQGLQSLAMAHGGSLEINPETGLPKAGFLKSILPTVLGAVLAPFTGGLSAALLVGAGTGLVEKDWKKGLLAGLGAFGGAGIGSALAGTGASAGAGLTGEALKEASKTAAGNIMKSTVGAGTGTGNLANIGRGIASLGDAAAREAVTASIPGIGGMFGGKAAMAAAAAPMLLAEPDPLKAPKTAPPMFYTGTEFEQELNPNRDQPGQAYFTQRFTPGQFTTQMPLGMAEGGKTEADKGEGGKAPPPTMEEYYRSMLTAPARTAPANPALGQYLANLNQFVTAGTPKTSPTYVAPPPTPPTPPKDDKTTPPKDDKTTPPPPPKDDGTDKDDRRDDRRDNRNRTGPDVQDLYNFNNFKGFDPSTLAGFDPSFMQGINPFVSGYTGNETYNPQTQKFESAGTATQTGAQTTTPQGFDPSVLAGIDPSLLAGLDLSALGGMGGMSPFAQGYTPGNETYNPQTQKFEPAQTAQQTAMPDLGGGNDYASLFGQQFGQDFNAGPFRFDTSDIYNRMAENELMDMNPGMMQFNQGGISTLGGYSDGGRLLRGPGDGMSDNIPAEIRSRTRRQPARLADGEFVVPADVVSHLGNGSTDAGAKQLYKMMDKVRRARTKTSRQAKAIKPEKYIPGRRS
jgi:hypothetical protein